MRSSKKLKTESFAGRALFFSAVLFVSGCAATSGTLDPGAAKEAIILSGGGQKRPASPTAYEHEIRGELFASRGDFEAAAQSFEIACEADPEDFYLCVRLSELLVELGEYTKARSHVAEALENDRSNEFAWLVLAKIHYGQGRFDEAMKAARQAMQVEPRCFEAALWLANFFLLKKDTAHSAEVFRRVVEQSQMNAEAHLGLAKTSQTQGDWPEALYHFRLFLESSPHLAPVIEKIASAYIRAKDFDKAVDLLEIAAKADPLNQGLVKHLISMSIELGLTGRAAYHLTSLPLPRPSDLEGALDRARWLAVTGQPYSARSLIISYFGAHPDNPEARLALAGIEIQLLRFENARRLLDEFDGKWSAEQLQKAIELSNSIPR